VKKKKNTPLKEKRYTLKHHHLTSRERFYKQHTHLKGCFITIKEEEEEKGRGGEKEGEKRRRRKEGEKRERRLLKRGRFNNS